jgi:plastocyanin
MNTKMPWASLCATAVFLAGALGCGSSLTSAPSPASSPEALLDPDQVRTANPVVIITAAGVNPQVMHLDSPVTVKFTNNDKVSHKLEQAPELHFDPCPEMDQLSALQPGDSGSVTITRGTIICAYHDAAGPSNVAFQGLLVVH